MGIRAGRRATYAHQLRKITGDEKKQDEMEEQKEDKGRQKSENGQRFKEKNGETP